MAGDIERLIDEFIDRESLEEFASEYRDEIRKEFDKVSRNQDLSACLCNVFMAYVILCEAEGRSPYIGTRIIGTSSNIHEEDIKQGTYNYFRDFDLELNDKEENKKECAEIICKYLDEKYPSKEFWCRASADPWFDFDCEAFEFIILEFDKNKLDRNFRYRGNRHPFLNHLKDAWSHSAMASDTYKPCYNELFRRASIRGDNFLFRFEIDFDAISAIKYEGAENQGNIIYIEKDKGQILEELSESINVLIAFSNPVRIESRTNKKIRKLLEITKNPYSLIMDKNGDIFAVGKVCEEVLKEYKKIVFRGFMSWEYYVDGEAFLRYEKMIPMFCESNDGISPEDTLKLKATFGVPNVTALAIIVNQATKQKHGTMVVFSEDAKAEAQRLEESAICIEPTMLDEGLIESITRIDGAVLCDPQGICYAIGVILDGKTSNKADSSRGARYNSAIRYIEQQKEYEKKAFIVVISEDKYTNCFSTLSD